MSGRILADLRRSCALGRARAAATRRGPPILRDVELRAADRRAAARSTRPSARRGRPRVHARDYFAAGQPVVLVPAYYRCPQLCGLVQNGIASALRGLPLERRPRLSRCDLPASTRPSRPSWPRRRRRRCSTRTAAGADGRLPFPDRDAEAIRRLTTRSASATPTTRPAASSRTRAGSSWRRPAARVPLPLRVEFAPRDLKLALVEASAGKLGSAVDRLMLFCFMYDRDRSLQPHRPRRGPRRRRRDRAAS
jgi:protein SCO1/2